MPVDSEHSALHQCLRGGGHGEVARLLLTASGGPFRGRTCAELAAVTVDDALAHPTWKMGPKITVDSSTLMNKGLEVIEAHELFGVDYEQIEVVVHPQSIVHSMVEFCDGSTIAQLSRPDMRLPIGYALGWPARHPVPHGRIDWATLGRLDFEPPDLEAFPCLALAYEAGRIGGTAPAWLSGANEVAVEAFLAGRIPWMGIAETSRRRSHGMMERRRRPPPMSSPPTPGPAPWPGKSCNVAPLERSETAAPHESGARRRHRAAARLAPRPRTARLAHRPTSPSVAAPPDRSPTPEPPPQRRAAPAEAERPGDRRRSPARRGDRRSGCWPCWPASCCSAGSGAGRCWSSSRALVVTIVLHELGHYLTAKWSGMKVTEFFLGFGPRIWSFRRGETDYGVKAIPAGAYVKIIGMNSYEEVDPADEARTYRQQSYPRRLAVAVAGSAMHFLIALVLIFVLLVGFGTAGRRPACSRTVQPSGWTVTEVVAGSAAAAAGLQAGDRIVSVDGVAVADLGRPGRGGPPPARASR